MFAAFCAIFGVGTAEPTLAQETQAPPNTCASSSSSEQDGVFNDSTDQISLIASGLEAAATARSLLLDPKPILAAQWCLEEDALARSKSIQRWRNTAAGDGGALVARFTNIKGDTTIYLIRVAKGHTLMRTADGYRQVSNFAAILDPPDTLVITGYFAGQPNTEILFKNLHVRVRISKADGKAAILTPK